MEKVVIIMIGFVPIRSSNIPQIMEVKALPSIYEAPTKVKSTTLRNSLSSQLATSANGVICTPPRIDSPSIHAQ
jgi:hypothetical protein